MEYPNLNVDDESSFILYEEVFIHQIQKLIRAKEGMESKPCVIELCAHFEEKIHEETLKKLGIPESLPVWSRIEAIELYSATCAQFISALQTRELDWPKVYDDYHCHPLQIYQLITTGSANQKRKGGVSGEKKQTKKSKQVKNNSTLSSTT
jgi:hypothetical protein